MEFTHQAVNFFYDHVRGNQNYVHLLYLLSSNKQILFYSIRYVWFWIPVPVPVPVPGFRLRIPVPDSRFQISAFPYAEISQSGSDIGQIVAVNICCQYFFPNSCELLLNGPK